MVNSLSVAVPTVGREGARSWSLGSKSRWRAGCALDAGPTPRLIPAVEELPGVTKCRAPHRVERVNTSGLPGPTRRSRGGSPVDVGRGCWLFWRALLGMSVVAVR